MEQGTARLTLPIDPRKKAMLEVLCAREDAPPSLKIRLFIRNDTGEKSARDGLGSGQG